MVGVCASMFRLSVSVSLYELLLTRHSGDACDHTGSCFHDGRDCSRIYTSCGHIGRIHFQRCGSCTGHDTVIRRGYVCSADLGVPQHDGARYIELGSCCDSKSKHRFGRDECTEHGEHGEHRHTCRRCRDFVRFQHHADDDF